MTWEVGWGIRLRCSDCGCGETYSLVSQSNVPLLFSLQIRSTYLKHRPNVKVRPARSHCMHCSFDLNAFINSFPYLSCLILVLSSFFVEFGPRCTLIHRRRVELKGRGPTEGRWLPYPDTIGTGNCPMPTARDSAQVDPKAPPWGPLNSALWGFYKEQ